MLSEQAFTSSLDLAAARIGHYGCHMTLVTLVLRGGLVAMIVAGLAGCTKEPDFEAALGEDVPGTNYPKLMPVGLILAIDTGDPVARAEADQALEERAEALRAEAAALLDEPQL